MCPCSSFEDAEQADVGLGEAATPAPEWIDYASEQIPLTSTCLGHNAAVARLHVDRIDSPAWRRRLLTSSAARNQFVVAR